MMCFMVVVVVVVILEHRFGVFSVDRENIITIVSIVIFKRHIAVII